MFSTASNHYPYLAAAPLNNEPRRTSKRTPPEPSREMILEWHGNGEQLGGELCQRLVSHLDLDFAVYYRAEAEENALVLLHQSGLPDGEVADIRRLPLSPTVQREASGRSAPAAVHAGEPVVSSISGLLKATDFAAFFLLLDGRVVGCLGAGKCQHKRIQDGERREIAAAALQVAVALDHARLAALAAGLAERVTSQEQRRREMVATLAHELRNPLGALNNALFVMLASPADTSRFHHAGEVAIRQLRQQARLIDGLLDASQLDAGQVRLRRERLDLSDLVREAVEEHRSACQEAGLTLAALLPDVPAPVSGDRTRLRQVLRCLLENARRLTPAGGQITLQIHEPSDAGTIALTVRDTGAGMEPAFLKTLFQPFTQADQSLARGGGLGLGLSVARRLVELHGGTLRAHSDGLGHGAEFTVTLPRCAEAATENRSHP